MINIKNAVQRRISQLNESPKACHRAFQFGFLSTYVPRSLRRLCAGQVIHRYWVRGKLTKCLYLDGRCFADEGRQLPFTVELEQMPKPFNPYLGLALSACFLAVTAYGLVTVVPPYLVRVH